jgi:hypothetical protein
MNKYPKSSRLKNYTTGTILVYFFMRMTVPGKVLCNLETFFGR